MIDKILEFRFINTLRSLRRPGGVMNYSDIENHRKRKNFCTKEIGKNTNGGL